MKKGFTLVELLVVIVILGLIALVVYPSVIKIINDSRESAYESQIKIVEKAAKEWGVEHPNELPDDDVYRLPLSKLINDGYISDSEIKNPKNSNKNLCGVVEIKFINNNYEYNYNGKYGSCNE